jgi:hypothetical protein
MARSWTLSPIPSKTGLYFSVRFKDKTDFSLRYACDMFVVGADFCDFTSGR